jgi:hypothetical protein
MAWFLRRFPFIRLTGATLLVSLTGPASAGEGDTEITAVFATVHNGYERVKEADGSFKLETYSFGEGGFSGTPTKDKSVDEQSFRKIAETIAPVLARQGYVASFDADETQLLILVYWGTTGTEQDPAGGYDPGSGAITPPPPPPPVVSGGPGGVVVSASPPPVPTHDSQQMAFDAMTSARNRARDRDNFRNARILGYDELLEQHAHRPSGRGYLDLLDEIEDSRYFVVLRAYDFQLLRKEKKRKLLWEVRYSLRARDHLFDESLGAMTDAAGRYFGQASNGLVRKPMPVGRVRLAEPVYEFLPGAPEKK